MRYAAIDASSQLPHQILAIHHYSKAVSRDDLIVVDDSITSDMFYDPAKKEFIAPLSIFNFQASFSTKTSEIRQAFSLAMQPITATYTAEDIASFPTQEAEARAYEADPEADTPLLDFMVANRPSVDKPTLVSRILANSVIYKQVAGPAIGKKQHYEDLLYALKAQHDDPEQPDVTQADFDAIVVDFS